MGSNKPAGTRPALLCLNMSKSRVNAPSVALADRRLLDGRDMVCLSWVFIERDPNSMDAANVAEYAKFWFGFLVLGV